MKYIKHYYVDDNNNAFCCEASTEPQYKRHPWKEYEGLDVKIWLTDAEGVDVCLSEVSDSTSVETVASPCGKNSVQVLTKTEYDSVATPYYEAQTLFGESQTSRQEGDETLAAQKQSEGEAKLQEALTALHSL
jgi:hypothetical protein